MDLPGSVGHAKPAERRRTAGRGARAGHRPRSGEKTDAGRAVHCSLSRTATGAVPVSVPCMRSWNRLRSSCAMRSDGCPMHRCEFIGVTGRRWSQGAGGGIGSGSPRATPTGASTSRSSRTNFAACWSTSTASGRTATSGSKRASASSLLYSCFTGCPRHTGTIRRPTCSAPGISPRTSRLMRMKSRTADGQRCGPAACPARLREKLSALEENHTDRDLNLTVATAMLNSFLQDGSLWRDCGSLNLWDAALDHSLAGYLESWIAQISCDGRTARTPGVVRRLFCRAGTERSALTEAADLPT